MNELKCFECKTHIGWMTDSGPQGLPYCDECHEKEEALEDDCDEEDS